MEQNYHLISQKTFLMALSLTWTEFAIKTLSSGEGQCYFRNLKRGECNYQKPQGMLLQLSLVYYKITT